MVILLAAASPARSILNEQPFGTFVSAYTDGYQLYAADLNADGAVDLISGSSGSSSVLWTLGSGPTTLSNPLTLAHGSLLGMIDFDRDGLQDLVMQRSILIARSEAPPLRHPLPALIPHGEKAVVFRDRPHDPVTVVTATSSCFESTLLQSDFSTSPGIRECMDTDLTYLSIGEVNGDALTDLVLTLGATGEVHVWLGLGSG
ncbi:MAG TPA: VCBS repeat-containing protein, partial [Candidatus Krumholzibacteria bacterium]